MRHPGRPVFELCLWGGVERGGGSQGPAGEADSQETVCISAVGTCFRIWAREYSTLIYPVMGRGQGEPRCCCPSHPLALFTSPLYSHPQLPGKGCKESSLLPSPSQPPRPCHASQAAAGRDCRNPTFPRLLLPSWGVELSQESDSPGWDLLSSPRTKDLHVLLVCFHPWSPRC